MGGVERAADLLHHCDGLLGREFSLAAQERAEVVAIDVFHADEADTIRLAQVVNADHVLVRDIAGENELLLEAQQNRGISCQLGPDDLERDQAVQFAVAGLVHGPHTALSEHTQDFVASAEKHARLKTLEGGDAAGRRRTWKSIGKCLGRARHRAPVRQRRSVG